MLLIQFGTVVFPGECLSAGIFIAWLVPWRATEDTHKQRNLLVFFFPSLVKIWRNPGYLKLSFPTVFQRSGGWKEILSSETK